MNSLRLLRQKQLLTQRELAVASGVGIATISRVEAGRVKPSLRTIRALARALDVNPEEMRELLLSRQARLL
ncbi:MAG: helix-turn-helix transcriptional regulator [Dehalococcoidia bacterium]